MIATSFVDTAKIMTKGQITIPKDVRERLGLSVGNRVAFVVDGDSVRLMNSAVYAMQILQEKMQGEAGRVGLNSEDDVMALVQDIRSR